MNSSCSRRISLGSGTGRSERIAASLAEASPDTIEILKPYLILKFTSGSIRRGRSSTTAELFPGPAIAGFERERVLGDLSAETRKGSEGVLDHRRPCRAKRCSMPIRETRLTP